MLLVISPAKTLDYDTPPATAETVMARLRARGIIVRHFPGPVTGDHIRITIGTDEQTDFLLEVLGKGK